MRPSTMLIVGAMTLFLVLATLLVLEPQPSGKATTGTHVNISNSTPVNCSVALAQGLNTVSFPCTTTADPLGTILNGTAYWASYQYVPGGADIWKVHNPSLPSYVVSDLQYISRRAGYVVLMNDSSIVNVSGQRVASTSVPFAAGWNLLGYPSLLVQNVTDITGDIDNFTVLRTYNTTLQAYLVYTNPGGGTLVYVVPGEGYWVNATNAGTWTVAS